MVENRFILYTPKLCKIEKSLLRIRIQRRKLHEERTLLSENSVLLNAFCFKILFIILYRILSRMFEEQVVGTQIMEV